MISKKAESYTGFEFVMEVSRYDQREKGILYFRLAKWLSLR